MMTINLKADDASGLRLCTTALSACQVEVEASDNVIGGYKRYADLLESQRDRAFSQIKDAPSGNIPGWAWTAVGIAIGAGSAAFLIKGLK